MPVPVAIEEPIETLIESSRGLRVLVGSGEHPGSSEDFAAGVLSPWRVSSRPR